MGREKAAMQQPVATEDLKANCASRGSVRVRGAWCTVREGVCEGVCVRVWTCSKLLIELHSSPRENLANWSSSRSEVSRMTAKTSSIDHARPSSQQTSKHACRGGRSGTHHRRPQRRASRTGITQHVVKKPTCRDTGRVVRERAWCVSVSGACVVRERACTLCAPDTRGQSRTGRREWAGKRATARPSGGGSLSARSESEPIDATLGAGDGWREVASWVRGVAL